METTSLDLIKQQFDIQSAMSENSEDYGLKENEHQQLRVAATRLATVNPLNKPCPDGWSEEVWKRLVQLSYKERLVLSATLLAMEIDRVEDDEIEVRSEVTGKTVVIMTIGENMEVDLRSPKKFVRGLINILRERKLESLSKEIVKPSTSSDPDYLEINVVL